MTLNLFIAILAGMATAIPLIFSLIEYIRKAIREKNWSSLLMLIMNLMAEAESMFVNGADRKKWVMGMLEESAVMINYDIDMEAISVMIDELCSFTKEVNA